jgi:FG-GAP-like repeat/RTX calcium-binding nonapeptide repeat (4 copies)
MVATVDRMFLGAYSAFNATAAAFGAEATLARSGATDWSSAGGYVFNGDHGSVVLDSDQINTGDGSDHVYAKLGVILPNVGSSGPVGALGAFDAFPSGELGGSAQADYNYVYGFGAFGSLHPWQNPTSTSPFEVDAATIQGGAGNNVLFGEIGNDTIIGGSGNDQISGGFGFNTVGGGGGTNEIAFDRSRDTHVGGANDIARSSLDLSANSPILAVSWQSSVGSMIASGMVNPVSGPISWIDILAALSQGAAAPIATASANMTASAHQSISASSLFTAGDPLGNPIVEYDLWNAGTGGGHFVVNGVDQGVNQDVYVTALQLAQTTYLAGTGTDTLRVRVSDGRQWSAWTQNLTVTVPAQPVVPPNGQLFVGVGSFTTGGLAGVAWQNAGKATLWINGGGTFTQVATNGEMGSAWTMYGVGDFNGDGKTDMLWVNAEGKTAIWEMNGNNLAGFGVPAGQMGSAWHVAAIGDFNGDGKSDLLWVNNDGGHAAVWTMDGTVMSDFALTNGAMGSGWTVLGTGDFNHDGRADVLWENMATGVVDIWEMNGANLSGFDSNVGVAPGRFAGVGHFAGSSGPTSDIVWVDNTNKVTIWEMSNGQVARTVSLNGLDGLNWHLEGVGNFTGDANSDLMWISDTGRVDVWQVSGASVSSGLMPSPGGSNLQLASVGSGIVGVGETLELTGAHSGAIIFAGPTGTLQLDHSSTFGVTISGQLAIGDVIDLVDITAGAGATIGYTGNHSAGTLTVGDGTETATITLTGNYSLANFIASSDGRGGTLLVDPPIGDAASMPEAASVSLTPVAATADTPAAVQAEQATVVSVTAASIELPTMSTVPAPVALPAIPDSAAIVSGMGLAGGSMFVQASGGLGTRPVETRDDVVLPLTEVPQTAIAREVVSPDDLILAIRKGDIAFKIDPPAGQASADARAERAPWLFDNERGTFAAPEPEQLTIVVDGHDDGLVPGDDAGSAPVVASEAVVLPEQTWFGAIKLAWMQPTRGWWWR